MTSCMGPCIVGQQHRFKSGGDSDYHMRFNWTSQIFQWLTFGAIANSTINSPKFKLQATLLCLFYFYNWF